MLKQEYKIKVQETYTIFIVVESKDRAEAEKIIKDAINFNVAPNDCEITGDFDVQAKRMGEREVLTIEAEK